MSTARLIGKNLVMIFLYADQGASFMKKSSSQRKMGDALIKIIVSTTKTSFETRLNILHSDKLPGFVACTVNFVICFRIV